MCSSAQRKGRARVPHACTSNGKVSLISPQTAWYLLTFPQPLESGAFLLSQVEQKMKKSQKNHCQGYCGGAQWRAVSRRSGSALFPLSPAYWGQGELGFPRGREGLVMCRLEISNSTQVSPALSPCNAQPPTPFSSFCGAFSARVRVETGWNTETELWRLYFGH